MTVPKFSQTATAVLINLRTLDCTPLTFRAQFSGLPGDVADPEAEK